MNLNLINCVLYIKNKLCLYTILIFIKLVQSKTMNEKRLLLLREAAKILGVSTSTLRRWDSSGKISMIRTLGGQRRVSVEEVERLRKPNPDSIPKCCIYVRAKSNKEVEKGILTNREQRLRWEAAKSGYKVTHLIKEVGSCVRKSRPQLKELIKLATEREFDILLINDKEIFLPFAFEYFEHLFLLQNIKIIVLSPENLSPKEHSLDLLKYLVKICPSLNMKKEKQVLLKDFLSKSIKLLS